MILILSLAISYMLIDGVYNHSYVYQTYNSWTNSCNGQTVFDEVHLLGGYGDYCNQTLGNPKVIVQPDGQWWIYNYGDSSGSDTVVGDAVYLVIREPSFGHYKTDPDCESTAKPRLKMTNAPDLCFLRKCYWGCWGGLCTGITPFKAPSPNFCGIQYFGIVGVFDFGNCTPENFDDRFYLSWAGSRDGIKWRFWKGSGDPSNCDFDDNAGQNWTDDPKQAKPIIYRDGFQSDGNDKNTFWHSSGFYSDPSFGGDGYFYLLFGYAPSVGIWPISVRFNICTNEQKGFCGDPEIYYGVNAPCGTAPRYCPFSGMIPKNFDCAGNSFIQNLADPHDWRVMRKSNGTFSHLLLVYDNSYTFNTGRVVFRTSQSKKFPFIWSEEREYELCKLAEDGYSSCAATGTHTGIAKEAGYDSNGDPLSFYAYTSELKNSIQIVESKIVL